MYPFTLHWVFLPLKYFMYLCNWLFCYLRVVVRIKCATARIIFWWLGIAVLFLDIFIFNLNIQIVNPRYLEVQGTLKHFEISVPRHIRFAELRKKKIITQPHFTNEYVVWRLKLEMYWKYCGKEEKLLLRSNFSSFSTIFCYLSLDFHVKTWTIFSLQDKRLFEISKVEITWVDCT